MAGSTATTRRATLRRRVAPHLAAVDRGDGEGAAFDLALGLFGALLGVEVELVELAAVEMGEAGLQRLLLHLGQPLVIGLIALAAGLAMTGYLLTRLAWRTYLVRSWRQRRLKRKKSS